MKRQEIGIDIAETKRFRSLNTPGQKRFMINTFSDIEKEYCLSYRDSAVHLAGTFAAKEAARKASGKFSLPLNELEVRRTKSGKPEIWVHGKRDRSLIISITHSRLTACAVALYTRP